MYSANCPKCHINYILNQSYVTRNMSLINAEQYERIVCVKRDLCYMVSIYKCFVNTCEPERKVKACFRRVITIS